MYSNTGIVFQPTDISVSHKKKKLKSSISHSSMSSHVRTRARSTTLLAIWNLLLVQLCRANFPPCWLLLQGTVTLWAVPSRVISPIWLRLQGMTRAWMRTKIFAEKQATTMAVFFVAYVEPRTDVFGWLSPPFKTFVSVTGVSVEEGPPREKDSSRCMWQYNEE